MSPTLPTEAFTFPKSSLVSNFKQQFNRTAALAATTANRNQIKLSKTIQFAGSDTKAEVLKYFNKHKVLNCSKISVPNRNFK